MQSRLVGAVLDGARHDFDIRLILLRHTLAFDDHLADSHEDIHKVPEQTNAIVYLGQLFVSNIDRSNCHMTPPATTLLLLKKLPCANSN